MVDKFTGEISLERLHQGFLGVTEALGAIHAEACLVCFHDQNHPTGVFLEVGGSFSGRCCVNWQGAITEQMLRAWQDETYTTEQAAYGIAFLLIVELTGYTVIEKSWKTTGFDYWLGNEITDDILERKARLEVSGLRAKPLSRVRSRVKEKLKQTHPTDGKLPAIIVVVEFSKPLSHVVKK